MCSSDLLESIDLSGTDVTEIPNEAFKDFTALEKAILPETLQKIGDRAFYKSSLKSIVIPNSVTEMGNQAFSAYRDLVDTNPNYKLESVVIGSGLKVIDALCFFCQKNLKSVTFAEGSILEKIFVQAFYNCKSLETIKLPESLKEIHKEAFYNCGLTEISIPDNVVKLQESCFSNCNKVTKITISKDSKLESIGTRAFYFAYAPSSRTIELPASLKEAGADAFKCHDNNSNEDKRIYYIDTIILHSNKVLQYSDYGTSSSSCPFGYYKMTKIKIKVPEELVEGYKNERWVKAKFDISNIEAIEE